MKSRFPLWKYLNQRLFDPKEPFILNPDQFWQQYQIQYLERCWTCQYRPEENFHS